jgi:hypothetical protein
VLNLNGSSSELAISVQFVKVLCHGHVVGYPSDATGNGILLCFPALLSLFPCSAEILKIHRSEELPCLGCGEDTPPQFTRLISFLKQTKNKVDSVGLWLII